MAVRVHNLPRKTLGQDSIRQMPDLTGNYSPLWNSQEQPFSQTVSNNISFKVEYSPQHRQDVEHLGLQFRDNGSPSTQSSSHFSGLFNAYGPQAIIQSQIAGIAPGRVPLPPDLAQDGPIYVNAKQYNAILRRRQMRAKLEASNKLVKNRKQPYLHESRHQHAVKRVRGSGGRFLSKKEQQQYIDSTRTTGPASASAHQSHRGTNMARTEVKKSKSNERDNNGTSGNLNFQQPDNKFSSASSHMALSMHVTGGFYWK